MKAGTKQENIEINFLKLFFAIMIFLFHSYKFNGGTPVFFGYGYIGVEFFFILNGYFMYESFSRKETNTQDFVLSKLKKIYPIYISAFIIAFISRNIIFKASIAKIIKNLSAAIFEIIPVWMFGVPIRYGYNGPTWYISSMLIGYAIVYPLLKKIFSKNIVSAFVVSFVCYSIIFQNVKTINVADTWWYITFLGNIRAIANMCLGICCCYLVKYIRNITNNTNINVLCFVAKIISICFIIAYTHLYGALGLNKTYDLVCVMFIFVLIMSVFLTDIKLPKNNVITILSKLSNQLSMLLFFSHRCIIFQLANYVEKFNFAQLFMLYCCGTVVSMACTYLISKILIKLFTLFKKRVLNISR